MFTPNQSFPSNHNNLLKETELFVLGNFKYKFNQLISEKISSLFEKDLIENINFENKTFNQSLEINIPTQENPDLKKNNLKKTNYFENNNNFLSDENSSISTSQQSKRKLIKKMKCSAFPKAKYMVFFVLN
jgi:hypothetical protein